MDIDDNSTIEKIMQKAADVVANTGQNDFFNSLVKNFAELLDVKYSFIAECVDNNSTQVQTLAFWAGDKFIDNIIFTLNNTPCEYVYKSSCLVHHETDVNKNFLSAKRLDYSIEGYLGFPLIDSNKKVIGHLALLDTKPILNSDIAEALFKIFSTRAASELERKRIENALQHSENKFSNMFQHSGDAVFLLDIKNNVIIDVNKKACDLLYYSKDELVNKKISDIHPEEMDTFYTFADEVFRLGNAQTEELTCTKKDGTKVSAEIIASIFLMELNSNVYILATVRDLSEKKHAENALRESERRLSTLMGNLPGMAYRRRRDEKWSMDFVSHGCKQLIGYEPEDLINNKTISYNGCIHPDDQEKVWKDIQAAINNKQEFRLVYRILTIERTEKWVWEQGVAVFDKHDNISALEGFIADITETKLAQQKIDNLVHQNKLILEAAGEGIYGLDIHGNATFSNPETTAITGWSTEEILGHNTHELMHYSKPDGTRYPQDEYPIYATFKDGKIMHVDNEIFWRKDGTSFPVEYTSTPIYEADKLCGAVVVFRDITERKENEDNLEKALLKVKQLKEQLQAENTYLQEEIKTEYNFDEFIGDSREHLQILEQIKQVAPTDATVLIQGESGTGKELVARAIQSNSNRSNHPLVKVNCTAISAGLVESELFGHEKGAFTGAHQTRQGRFEIADGGTLFLDEIGELSMETQVKLLRVLQEGEFERVGSNKTHRVNVRIISATNRNLAMMVKNNTFRMDLFYRLGVFPLNLPPLRKCKDDIPKLAQYFLNKIAKKLGKAIEGLAPGSIDALMNYDWPGNVRELQNILERAAITTDGSIIDVTQILHINPAIQQHDVASNMHNDSGNTLEEIEREYVKKILNQTDWVIAGDHGAAKILGLHPNTLRARIKKLGVHR